MKKKIIECAQAPQAIGTYSQGIIHSNLCFFSGQIGINPKTGDLPDNFLGQIKQVLANIDALLNSQKLKRENILKTTIFLTDIDNFNVVNEEYSIFFEKPYPARSCVEVSELPHGALVEIEVIAALG